MRLVELNIKNYKSLGDVTFRPGSLSVLVGPNGSGKSNFASALSFLAEVYEFGLETAVRRKGGFENMVMRGGRNPIVEFDILIRYESDDYVSDFSSNYLSDPVAAVVAANLRMKSEVGKYLVRHRFVIVHSKNANKSEFNIEREEITCYYDIAGKENRELYRFLRDTKSVEPEFGDIENTYFSDKTDLLNLFAHVIKQQNNLQELTFLPTKLFELIKEKISSWAIYQLNPLSARQPGSPTPNPEINTYGDNLPSLVDWLKTKHPEKWTSILNVMQSVLPTLTDISTDYLHNRRLGLFFFENESKQPWNSEEVSDGTILTLSILCAIFDPRKPLVLIEEIENSLHPWALRSLIEEIRKQSEEKNIILTTHSPLVLDMLYPKEVWCLSKPQNETHLDRLVDLAPEIEQDWKNGDIRISDYLDAGLVPNAVPGGLL